MQIVPLGEGFMTGCFLGAPAGVCKESIQSRLSEFKIDAKYKEAWKAGLQLLGKPLSARLTSRADIQFLDVYFQ